MGQVCQSFMILGPTSGKAALPVGTVWIPPTTVHRWSVCWEHALWIPVSPAVCIWALQLLIQTSPHPAQTCAQIYSQLVPFSVSLRAKYVLCLCFGIFCHCLDLRRRLAYLLILSRKHENTTWGTWKGATK